MAGAITSEIFLYNDHNEETSRFNAGDKDQNWLEIDDEKKQEMRLASFVTVINRAETLESEQLEEALSWTIAVMEWAAGFVDSVTVLPAGVPLPEDINLRTLIPLAAGLFSKQEEDKLSGVYLVTEGKDKAAVFMRMAAAIVPHAIGRNIQTATSLEDALNRIDKKRSMVAR